MDNIFGNIGQDITKAAQGVGGAISGALQGAENFTKPVQNFMGQAAQGLAKLPGEIGNDPLVKAAGNYFSPTAQGPNAGPTGFWSQQNPVANIIAGQQRVPQFQLPNMGAGQAVNRDLGGGVPGQIGQAATDFVPNFLNSIVNAPGQIAQGSIDFARDVNTNQLTGQHALSDLGETGQGMLTIGTLGEGSLVKGIAEDSWKKSVVKGLVNSMPVGAGFGLTQGLAENRDAQSVGQQFQQSMPYIVGNMLGAGVLSTVLGPGGKLFFGNKTPGTAAALTAEGVTPPETIRDAYSILGVSPNATLDDIRTAYTQAASQFHPNSGGTPESLDVLNNAYEMTTQNTAPKLTFDGQGNPMPEWSNEFGGNTLTQAQVVEARKAASQNTAFQARVENAKNGNVSVRNPQQPDGVVTTNDFLEKGADLISPEGNSQVIAKTRQSAENQPQFHDALDQIAQQYAGRALSSVKDPNTMARKILEHRNGSEPEYGLQDVGDSLRGAVVVQDESQIPQTAQAIENEVRNRGWKVTNTQDFFGRPGDTGYKGYHIDIEMPDGQKAEVQLHTPASWASARLTHPAYEQYDENLPDNVQQSVSGLQRTIDNNTPGQNDDLARRDEQLHQDKVLSPMESDYSNFPNPDRELAMGQLQQQGTRVGKNLSARQTGKAPLRTYDDTRMAQIRAQLGQQPEGPSLDEMGIPKEGTPRPIVKPLGRRPLQEKTIGQLQQEHQDPDLTTYENAMNKGDTQTMDALAQQHPNDTRYQVHSNITPRLKGLTNARTRLQAQLSPQEPSELQGMIRMRNGLQQDLNAAQNQSTVPGMRVQVKTIQDKIAKVDSAIADRQGKAKVAAQQKTEAVQTHLDQVEKDITDEKTNIGVKTAVNQEKIRIRNQNPEEKTPQQESFERNVPVAQVQAERDAKADLPQLETPDSLVANKRADTAVQDASFTPTQGIGSLWKAVTQPLAGSLMKSQDIRARQLGYGVKDAMDFSHALINKHLTALEDARSQMNEEDYSNATQALEGKAPAANPAVANWVKTAQGVYQDMLTKARSAGIPTGEIEQYFTHAYTKQQIEQMSRDPDIQNGVIQAGNATNPAEASTWIMNNAGRLNMNEYGSLHIHRSDLEGKYPYIQDPRIVEDYVKNAGKEIGFTSVFGENMAKANQLVNSMQADGNQYDAGAAQQLMKTVGATYGAGKSPEEQAFSNITQALNNFETMSKLQMFTTAVHHAPALGQASARLGTGNVLRSLPEGLKAIFGSYSDDAKLNVNRLHETNTSQLYGQPSGILEKTKFYSAIGLNKAISSLSAVVNKAAEYRVGDLEKDIQTGDPSAQTIRDIQQAGLPYNDILQRGRFTPAEKAAYTTAALKDSSLYLSPEDMPKLYSSTLGHLIGQFAGPTYQRTMRMYPYIAKEVMAGRMNPLIALLVGGTLYGTMSQEASNLIQNKPADTVQKTLLSGALRGVAPIGGEQAAQTVMYPQYASSELAGLGGPFASDLVNAQQVGSQLMNPSTRTAGERQLLRNVPGIGVTLANTFMPSSSYVGNRPSDLVKILATGNQPQTPNPNYPNETIQHSAMDFFRQNPGVTANNQKVAQASAAKKAMIGSLNSRDQQTLGTVDNLLSGGSDLGRTQAYSLLGSNPQIAQAYGQYKAQSEQANGQPVNPLWAMMSVQPGLAQKIVQYKGMLPGDQTVWKKDPQNKQLYNDYSAMEAIYYQHLAKTGGTSSSGSYNSDVQAPTPSNHVSQVLAQYNQSKAGGGKPNYALIDNDPQVQQYFALLDNYDNYINSEAGLPRTAGGSSGSGYTSYSKGGGSLQSQLRYMLDYQMTPTMPAIPKLNFRNPSGLSQQEEAQLNANPLKAYYAQAPQMMARIMASAPKIAGMPDYNKLPTMAKLPKIGAQLGFSENPTTPPGTQGTVQAGRVSTGNAGLRA